MTSLATSAPLVGLALLAGCSSDFALDSNKVAGPAGPNDDVPLDDDDEDASSGELHYLDADDDLEGGVVITGVSPFRSFTLVATAPEDSELSMRFEDESGVLGDWESVVIDEDLGAYTNGHQVLPHAVDFVELRASGGASFVQAVLYEGTTPMYDDDPGESERATRSGATPARGGPRAPDGRGR